jgi:hypothetical protein
MNADFDNWYLSQDVDDIDPEDIARAAWEEAYARATEQAARICEYSADKVGIALAYQIRSSLG